MSGVLCRRGVRRGAASPPFSAAELLQALAAADGPHVYMELDSGAALSDASARAAARLCVRARLAPHVPARTADVTLCGAGADVTDVTRGMLRVRAAADLAPHAELLLWFADDALAALDMPFLTPRNIRGRRDYVCHLCHAGFDEPNPLKLHLFLSCAPFEPRAFWRTVAARLAPPPAPPAPLPPLPPAELEALATAWGRSRAGHVCVYCGKLYSRRYGLKIHIRTHTGYRPLRCGYCARAFGDPSNLNKHVRLHARPAAPACPGPASPPRYPCAHCGRALARRRDLERHERTHTLAHTPSLTHTPTCTPTHTLTSPQTRTPALAGE